MTKLIFYMPPSSDSSPGRVASKVWEYLYDARDALELDLLLLSDDPRMEQGYPDTFLEPSKMREHVGDGVFYFPVSPILGPSAAFGRLRRLHRLGARLVSDCHGDVREDLYNHGRNRDPGLFLYTLPAAVMAPVVLNWHEWIVLHSKLLEGFLKDRYSVRARMAVVPNAIDAAVLDGDSVYVDLEGEFTICFHGRMTYEKGLDLLLDAVASLPEVMRGRVHLHLFGRGPMERALHRRASRHGLVNQVHFRGHHPMEEVYPALRSADLLVYPSRFDNFPVSVLEALAVAEAPVLFSDRMGLVEFMDPSLAVNAFPLSLKAIREVVLRAIEGGADVDATVRQQRAFARMHTWDRVIDEYLAFFNGLQ